MADVLRTSEEPDDDGAGDTETPGELTERLRRCFNGVTLDIEGAREWLIKALAKRVIERMKHHETPKS
jgi:hypothetical protein